MSIMETVGNKIHNNTLEDAGLDWRVELSSSLCAPTTTGEACTMDRRATVRTDTNEILGVVSPDYKVVQNSELVYMAERIANSDNLKIDSAGELRNGARVWLAVQASSFNVGNHGVDDEIKPYLLLTNGHDGLFSLSATPTSVRPVCENTLNMALQEGRKAKQCISIRHKGNMDEKIQDLTDTMQQFYARSKEFEQQANYLAGCNMNSTDVSEYFNASYNNIIKNVPVYDELKTDSDHRAYNKKQATIMKWWNNFDSEADLGSNAWIAFNAVTKWVDHQTSFRGDKKAENRFSANFYGTNASKKQELLSNTLAMV